MSDDVLHDVHVVGGEVDGDACVNDPRGQRADARGLEPEDLAEPALGEHAAHGGDGRVEALDVTDHELETAHARRRSHTQRVRHRGRDRLLDEHVLAGLERAERHVGVVPGGHRDDHGIHVRTREHVVNVAVAVDVAAPDALLQRGRVRVRDGDQARILHAVDAVRVEAAHLPAPMTATPNSATTVLLDYV